MILIFSKRNFETSTEKVIDWISYFGGKYVRINGDDFYKQVSIEEGKIKGLNFSIEEINVIWNRRWDDEDPFLTENIKLLKKLSLDNVRKISSNITSERMRISDYFFNQFERSIWTTRKDKMGVNKIEMLKIAKQCGLNTPEYLITSKKQDLLRFKKKHGGIIAKPISEISMFSDPEHNSSCMLYVGKLSMEIIKDKVNENFHFTLFQEYIEKEFEIRTYFLNGNFYSIAIFSQNDKQTSVDFRNYNRRNPNRRIPYKLPKSIELKLFKFMKINGFKVGSFDIIKCKSGEYYFLEINPVGQFGMVSFPANYHLEKEMAKYLINEDKNNNSKTGDKIASVL